MDFFLSCASQLLSEWMGYLKKQEDEIFPCFNSISVGQILRAFLLRFFFDNPCDLGYVHQLLGIFFSSVYAYSNSYVNLLPSISF